MVEGVKGWQIRWYSLGVEGLAVTEDFWTATSMALVVPQTTTPGKMSPKGKERSGRDSNMEGGRKEEEKQPGEGAPGVGVSRRRWDRASSRVIQ